MAQSVRIEINEGHKLYKYCDRLTKAAGALWNAGAVPNHARRGYVRKA